MSAPVPPPEAGSPEPAELRNTQWSFEAPHPSGYYWLPEGSRRDRLLEGKTITVTRQIPPGLTVGVDTPDHPHSLKWCLFVDGLYCQLITGVFECMGCITDVLNQAEDAAGCPRKLKDASKFYFQINEALTSWPADKPRIGLASAPVPPKDHVPA